MARKLQRKGFIVIPVFTVYDEETGISGDIQADPTQLPDGEGALGLYEERWPQTYEVLKGQWEAGERGREILAGDTKPPRAARRASAAKKVAKRAPAAKKAAPRGRR